MRPAHDEQAPDVAGVLAPPPIFFVAGLAVGLLLDRLRPLPRLPRAARRGLGPPLIAAGAGLVLWSGATMHAAGTEAIPTRPSTVLVAHGPFSFTRNPIYLGFTLIYIGLALVLGRLPPLVLLPAVLAAFQKGVVEREERYLERRFGAPYRAYRQRVRRWL
jgi:protein-S-isoprenylcysteine O-methyltransferase Ste14